MHLFKVVSIKSKTATFFILFTIFSVLTGCASYQAMPLPKNQQLLDIKMLVAQATSSPLIKPAALNIDDGLSLDEIAILALYNSPNLQVEREKYLLTKANAYNLGLLPDPQLSASFDNPTGNVSNVVNAWTGGIGFDLNTLITHQTLLNVGSYQTKQAKLAFLWQAWQIIQQAKSLSLDIYFTQQKTVLVQSMISTLEQRYQQSQVGLSEGNITLETNGIDLSALLNAYSQLKQLHQNYNASSHQLTKLLGINNTTPIPFATLGQPVDLSKEIITTALISIENTRPDLLALQAGYQAQEGNVSAEILAQFPALNVGITAAKDTGSLHTRGFNIGITLPLFNGNKGGILIARTIRQKLAKEYQQRVIKTRTDVDQLWKLNTIITQQQMQLAKHLPTLKKLVFSAKKAYKNGDIAALPFINIESNWFDKQLEQLDLRQNSWQTQLSLSLLLMQQNLSTVQPNNTSLIFQHK